MDINIIINENIKADETIKQEAFKFSKLEELQKDNNKISFKYNYQTNTLQVETLSNNKNKVINAIKKEVERLQEAQRLAAHDLKHYKKNLMLKELTKEFNQTSLTSDKKLLLFNLIYLQTHNKDNFKEFNQEELKEFKRKRKSLIAKRYYKNNFKKG